MSKWTEQFKTICTGCGNRQTGWRRASSEDYPKGYGICKWCNGDYEVVTHYSIDGPMLVTDEEEI